MPPLRSTGTSPEAEHPEYAGQYLLEERLGSGGMGVVHLARSPSGMRLAVKVVHAEFSEDDEFRARFRQEVAAARRVSGAFTAPVVDADPDALRPWMATLYIPGLTLSEHVKRHGPLPPGEVRRLAAGLAEALRDIHRAGVVHRDLKPGNVLLAPDGPKVIDFGISRPSDSDLRTETGKLIGTPPFMAPEQFQRPRSVGPAADVFALGSVLVHAATGRGPFDSESPYIVAYQVVHDEPKVTGVPEDLVPVVRSCLAKDPEQRPTADALRALLRATAPQEASPGRAPLVRVPAQRRPSRAETTHPGPASAPRAPGELAEPEGRLGHVGRRIRWVAAGTAVAVLLGAGVAMAVRQAGGSPGEPQGRSTAVAFRPWTATLAAAGAPKSAVHAPFCSYAAGALACAARGVQAARLDPATGREVWSRPDPRTAASGSGEGTSAAAPVLCGGLLHVLSPDGNRLEALDPRSGRTRWTRDVSAYAGRVYHAADSVLLVSGDGRVRALNGASGRARWQHAYAGHDLPVFTAYAGTAYATTVNGRGSRTQVTAIDPATGAVRWERRLTGDLTPAGVGSGGALLLTSTDAQQRTDAVVRYEPERRRAVRVPLEFPLPDATAVVRGDVVHLLGFGGTLLALDSRRTDRGRAGSAELWRMETSVSNASSLVVADDRLYLSAADGRLLAVDARRGHLVGQTPARMNPQSRDYVATVPAPVTAAGTVYATAPDGTIFGVDARRPSRW